MYHKKIAGKYKQTLKEEKQPSKKKKGRKGNTKITKHRENKSIVTGVKWCKKYKKGAIAANHGLSLIV
jgi:hypothetical protein